METPLAGYPPKLSVTKQTALWSCVCVIMEEPPGWLTPWLADPPCLAWERDGWLGRSAFTLTKRTCFFFRKIIFWFAAGSSMPLPASVRHSGCDRFPTIYTREVSRQSVSWAVDGCLQLTWRALFHSTSLNRDFGAERQSFCVCEYCGWRTTLTLQGWGDFCKEGYGKDNWS